VPSAQFGVAWYRGRFVRVEGSERERGIDLLRDRFSLALVSLRRPDSTFLFLRRVPACPKYFDDVHREILGALLIVVGGVLIAWISSRNHRMQESHTDLDPTRNDTSKQTP
jgi:hypothetical protein